MKYQFLKGLNSASNCDGCSYAQGVSLDVNKNAVACKNSGWNVGNANRIGKIPNMGAHKVTMCNNSGHIKKRIADQMSDVNKKQLIGKHQKRHSKCVSVYDSRDFSVPTRNKFASLVVEPSSDESPDMADIDLVVAHSQVNDTGIGLNLSAVDCSLQKNSYMADSSLVVAQSHTTDAKCRFQLFNS